MPLYEYRCQKCREVFGIERSMTDETAAACIGCGSDDVSRIWNAYIRTGGSTPDVGQGSSKSSSSGGGGGGCGSCSSHSCGTCH
jgi:putative FmdB family regulatory protein